MSERYVTLLGAEDVRSAGHTIASAATGMERVANNIDGALERHQRFMDDWLSRFEQVLRDDRFNRRD
jgi:hypothetical protein